MEYVLLFLAAFAAATVLPLPSEVPLILIVRDGSGAVLPVIVATCGNYLGACTTYALARGAIRRFMPDSSRWTRAADWIRRFGAPALLLSWVPLVGDALVAVAGVARMPFGAFSLWTAIGKGARYAVVAWGASP